MQEAFKIIIKNGGSYALKDLLPELEKELKLDDYEKERYEKTGYIHWQSMLYFYSIDCTKAGWLRKDKGVWSVTEDGKKALKMDPETFIRTATHKYREWKKQRGEIKEIENEQEIQEIQEDKTASYDQAFEGARQEIREYIEKFLPYEFQNLVAALLRGMGYYTPFIASPGPDGGLDIIAYKDPLGAEGARIKVQVKHRIDAKVSNQEVSALNGILQNGDMGLIVSSGGFSPAAIRILRSANNHIEKMDLDDLINLWEEYYDKLSQEDRQLLPLKKISFIAPEE